MDKELGSPGSSASAVGRPEMSLYLVLFMYFALHDEAPQLTRNLCTT